MTTPAPRMQIDDVHKARDLVLRDVHRLSGHLTLRLPYLGIGWCGINVIADMTVCASMNVRLAAVDYNDNLYINPAYWLAETDDSVRFFVLIHELMHPFSMHQHRRPSDTPRVMHPRFGAVDAWNLAGDFAINAWIHDIGKDLGGDFALRVPGYAAIPTEARWDWEAERHYEAILQEFPILPPQGGGGSGDPDDGDDDGNGDESADGSGSPGSGDGDDNESGGDANDDGSAGQPRPGAGCGAIPAPAGEGIDASHRVDWGLVQAQAVATQGSGSAAAFGRLLHRPPKPISVRELVRSASQGAVRVNGRATQTYRRRNRRQGQDRFILPGFTAHKPKVAVVIDTSGSMGEHAIAQCVRICVDISNECGVEILLVAHTHRVYATRWIHPHARFDAIAGVLTDTGGTDFVEALATVERHKHDRFEAMVQITDGYCNWPDPPTPKNVKRHTVALVGVRTREYIPEGRKIRVVEARVD